jgi:uncharacterized membrane protein YdbT with pleckstrin-like domain
MPTAIDVTQYPGLEAIPMSLRQWLSLLVACLLALVGLFVAADAGQGTLYGFGLLVFVAAVVYAFALVKWYFDRLDAERH